MSLKIYLLGQFKLQADDKLFELPSRPSQSLLSYLALNTGITQRREKLACLLWPEATESNARGYLRQALWRVRKALDGTCLKSSDYLQISDISLTFEEHADFWLDAHQLLSATDPLSLDELIAKVSLYQGELLPGFYDEWVMLERDRLLSTFHQVMTQLLEGLIQDCRWDEALRWSDHWIRLGHAPEPAYRAMMRAHAGSGDQGMVSATYQRCRETLSRNLGLDPSPETQQLFERILCGELEQHPSKPKQINSSEPQLPAFLHSSKSQPVEEPIFVARNEELSQLQGLLDKAHDSRGRIAFVTGEAGIGKTTLLQEFTKNAQTAMPDLVIASGNCNAHTGIGDPYLPFREILELLTGDVEARWEAGAITREHAIRLWNNLPTVSEALVEVGPDLVDTFVPGPGLIERSKVYASLKTDWVSRLNEVSKRRKPGVVIPAPAQINIFEQYTRVLQLVARHITLVLVIDDLQWADLGSISLLFHIGRNLSGSRILILGAYRPEEVALGRGGDRHPLESVINEFQREFGEIAVNIDHAENREFLNALVDSEPNNLGPSFREMLFRQTHGHPLFTLELLWGMQERGDLILNQNGLWDEGATLDWETLPARVEAVIAERINRLDTPLQTILRVASIEGETFTVEVVERVLDKEDLDLFGLLSVELDRKHRLISAQSIQRINGRLISNYRFRHILTQRYLYSKLNEVERVHLHDQIGRNLEVLYGAHEAAVGEEIKSIAPQLARHFQESRITSKAISYLRQAGERAAFLSAYQDSISHLKNGMAMLEEVENPSERAHLEVELQLALGFSWQYVGGAQSVEMKEALIRAYELCQKFEYTSHLGQVLAGLSTNYYVRAEYHRALELAEEVHAHAIKAEDSLLASLADWYSGYLLFCLGDIASAQDHLEKVITFYKPDEHHYPFLFLRGSDVGLGALAYSACCLWCLGYPDQASQRSQEALDLAKVLNHQYSLADVFSFAGCFFNHLRRDAEALKYHAEQLVQIARKNRFAGWAGTGSRYKGMATYMIGNTKAGIKQMRQGITEMQSTGIHLYKSETLGLFAEAQGKTGQVEDGLVTLEEATQTIEKTNERIWEAEIHRIRADLLKIQGDFPAAEDSYQKAIQVALQQHAKSFELRASTGLACLWKSQGRVDEARELLEEIYAWFTEGFDTPDLKEAKSTLDELS